MYALRQFYYDTIDNEDSRVSAQLKYILKSFNDYN